MVSGQIKVMSGTPEGLPLKCAVSGGEKMPDIVSKKIDHPGAVRSQIVGLDI